MSEKARRYYQEYLEKGFSIEDSKDLAEAKEKKEDEKKETIESMKEKTFDEYWTTENELWSLSMEESFRQRDERLEKLGKNHQLKKIKK